MTIKTRIAFICLITLAATACNKKTNNHRQLIAAHFKYMNQHNVAAIKNQYADSAMLYSYIMPGYKRGPLGADEIYHFMFFQSPSEQYRVVDVMDNDTAATVQYDVMGYASMNVARSGYSFRNCTVFKIKNGKITSEVTYTGKTSTEASH